MSGVKRALRQFTFGTGKTAGRNSAGRITSFHRGGGAKRLQRTVDHKRNTASSLGVVERIEYDPNRSSKIALVRWIEGVHHRRRRAASANAASPKLLHLDPATNDANSIRGVFALNSMLPHTHAGTSSRELFLSALASKAKGSESESVSSLGIPRFAVAAARAPFFAQRAIGEETLEAVARGLKDPSFRVIQNHFAISGNLGEVAAKEEVWEVVAQLVGLSLGILILDTPGLVKSYGVISLTWLSMRLLHLWLCYESLSVLQFNTINIKRARILVKSHVLHSTVPGCTDSNREVNILAWSQFMKPKIIFGLPLEKMDGVERSYFMVEALIKLYASEKYILMVNQQTEDLRFYVSFKVGATNVSVLRSVWQSFWLSENWDSDDNVRDQIATSLMELEEKFEDFIQKLKDAEWDTQQFNLKVVVVSGETGCGKTTQLPQYILESEIEAARGAVCNIICTQPRRISAMSVSERVAAERGEKLGESVGYKVRLEGMKGRDTRLLFCTTGVLLRRLLVDRNLKGVTHVIVDEIHERGMNEDFLLIVLKELLHHRPDLRLILMSATLNAELFSSYFNGAPTMHIPGFTFPVRAHFLEDILERTGYRLTPSNQIDDYGQEKTWKMQKQAQAFRKRKSQIASAVEDALEVAEFKGYSLRTRDSLSCWCPDSIGFNLIEHVLCHIVKNERPGAVLVFMTGWDDINSLKDQLQVHPLLGDHSQVLILACHGSMASSEQRLIFENPEGGVRKIVLATNMAETSITINDVVFVVDIGKAKETSYDALNNTPCLLPSWISKAAARQRRGRAGRVQPGECYHLYPRCVYDAFADYQLPELLRTPLQSLCLQIKTLQLGSISEFLSRALQPPEPLSVQNAIDYLKIIGALDENENLTVLGHKLAMLPVEPKLGKMLILGAIFKCLDPIMTVVAGLSVRDPFVMPSDKKDLAESAKAQLAARGYSDHLALIRAYEGWRDAEAQQAGYEYCWRNFLSSQTLRAIDSLRKQFFYLLKDIGLVNNNSETYNTWSHEEHLLRAVICAGLFPGISSVVNKDKSIALKTMEDGQVLLYSSSVNGCVSRIPFPWLVFNEKVKVNSVFLRDSTGISDSVLLLFGGNVSRGGLDGHLKMLGGYLEFFMKPELAKTYLSLKMELEELIQKKLLDPMLETQSHSELLSAVRLLVSEDHCDGRFVFGRQVLPQSKKETNSKTGGGAEGKNYKNHLQAFLNRAGHDSPTYKTKELKNNQFRTTVVFNGLNFVGQPCSSKKLAEKSAAAEALLWIKGDGHSSDDIDHASVLLKKSNKKSRKNSFSGAKWS